MQANYCGTCGFKFEQSDTHCGRCGALRDSDTSSPTLFIVPGSASTIASSNQQTFCINCGQPRPPHVFPCPFCNSSVPTIAAQMPIAQQMAADIPTPPLIVKDPTPQQVQTAMMSTVNPYGYGLWGDLVVDGSKKNVWDFPNKDQQLVQNAGLVTRLINRTGLHVMPNIYCQDFAYQTMMRVREYSGGNHTSGGIAFRVDETQDECYVFYRWTSSPLSWGDNPTHYLDVMIYDTHLTEKEDLQLDTFELEGLTALFAVVAQGTTLDFYVDLNHIARLETRFANSGSIGLCSFGYSTISDEAIAIEVRNTKLWVKNP